MSNSGQWISVAWSTTGSSPYSQKPGSVSYVEHTLWVYLAFALIALLKITFPVLQPFPSSSVCGIQVH